MDATDKYFKYQNFLKKISFFFIPGMFWRNLTKIGHIYIPFKFAYGECIRPKSNARVKLIRTHKVRLASRQQIITPTETANQWENGTSWRQCSQLQTRFPLISIVQWRVEKVDTIIGKVAKGKGKPRGKMEKTENMLRSKTTNRQSKLRFEAIVDDFVSWLVLVKMKGNLLFKMKGNLLFNFMYNNFWFDGDSFVRNLNASMELRFFFFNKYFPPLLILP